MAVDLLMKLRSDLPKIDRKLVQAGDEEEWMKLQSLFRHLIQKSDALLMELKDVCAAMAIFRRAKLDCDGSLSIDAKRIASIKGLLPDAFVTVLESIANMGVPLLLMEDKPTPDEQVKSHKSASLAIKEIVFNTLTDAMLGGVLVFSLQVQELLDSSGVIAAPLGAADKKLPNGDISQKKRVIHDLRSLNDEVDVQAEDQFAETGLTTSAAMTP